MDHERTSLGLYRRPATLDDGDAIVRIVNDHSWQIRGRDVGTPEQIRGQLVMPGIDLSQDTQLVFDPAGELVALGAAFLFAPYVHVQSQGLVPHEYQGRGIGAALLDWIEDRRPLNSRPPRLAWS